MIFFDAIISNRLIHRNHNQKKEFSSIDIYFHGKTHVFDCEQQLLLLLLVMKKNFLE